jgi:hypothetical protein
LSADCRGVRSVFRYVMFTDSSLGKLKWIVRKQNVFDVKHMESTT